MAQIHLYLFDNLRLTRNGQSIAIKSSSLTMLLGYLALYAPQGRAVTRARLARTLWPDLDEVYARRALVNALYRLRQFMGGSNDDPQLYSSTDETISLGPIWVDVDAFRSGIRSPDLADWRAALDLYTGDLLDDLDADWLRGPRMELREQFLATIARTCEALINANHFSDALLYAQRWSLADPFDEAAHRSVMLLYFHLGRYAAALEYYHQFARVLTDELDLEPLPETCALAQAIRAEYEAMPSSASIQSPLIGRGQERAVLIELVRQAQEGRGGVVFVEGEPGIGKTRLLETVSESALWRNLAVVWGHTNQFAGTTPYGPLVEALHAALAGPRADQVRERLTPGALETLAELLPQLVGERTRTPHARARGATALPEVLPTPWYVEQPHAVTSAFADLLEALADLAPHLVILDDVQWTEAGFWDALRVIAPKLTAQRVLLILSYRDEEARANPAVWRGLLDLDGALALPRITLRGLTSHECAQLACALRMPLDADALGKLYEGTHGNPLFVREVLSIPGHSRAAITSPALFENRLTHLDARAYEALEAGAVLGREFSYAVWRLVASVGQIDTHPLVNRRILEETDQGYRFSHDLMREHIYHHIKPNRRRLLHRRAGEALAREGAEPGLLAWHFTQAQLWSEAVHHYCEAGDAAARAYTYATALEHYGCALSLLTHMPQSQDNRLKLLCRRQRILAALVNVPAWRADLAAIEDLATALNSSTALLEVCEARLNLSVLEGNLHQMCVTGERALALARSLDNRAAEARIASMVGKHVALQLGRASDALPYLQLAQALAEALGDPPLLYTTLCNLAFVQCMLGQCRVAHGLATRALALTEAPGTRQLSGAAALQALAKTAHDQAKWETALETMRTAVQMHRESQNHWATAEASLQLAAIMADMGQYSEALHLLESIADSAREAGARPDAAIKHYLMWAKADALNAYVLSGDLSAAECLLHELKPWMSAAYDAPLVMALSAQGRLLLAQNRVHEAIVALQHALRLWDGQRAELTPLLLYALAAHRIGDCATAHGCLARAEHLLSQWDIVRFKVPFYAACFEIHGSKEALGAAYAELQRQAAQFADPQRRADFLEKVPLHREITAHRHNQQPASAPHTVWLTRVGVPLGRPLTNIDRVEVCWTVDAGQADAEILHGAGKVALRRHRIRRLIAEARSQGAAPTDRDLAQALGVTERTIASDMAAIKAVGEIAATRRRMTTM